MLQRKLKRNRWVTAIFSLLSIGSLVGFLVVYARADWHLFLIRPFWLGCVFVVMFGFGMMLSCLFAYSTLRLKTELLEIRICEKCGAECHIKDLFCSVCGEKLTKTE